ncbi:MAG: ABC transporter substrate-binding protein [Candidatus Acidiferrales bacterium]
MTNFHVRALCACSLLALLLVIPSPAEVATPGVTSTAIQLGSCSALSGPASFLDMQTQIGALAYLHIINDQGGVFGRKIEVNSFDDGYNPEQTSACFSRLLKQNVFAMGFCGHSDGRKVCADGRNGQNSSRGAFYRGAIALSAVQTLHRQRARVVFR